MDGGNRPCDADAMLEQVGRIGTIPLAYRAVDGAKTGIMFLGGFHSDMTGAKAEYLANWCADHDHAFVRFDYSGHGASGGTFADGTIGQWLDDAETVLLALTTGPQILVGSSMGGWIGLLLALRHTERVAAFVGIAAAPDFTEDLMWARFPSDTRHQIATEGQWERISPYGGSYPITRQLILEGRKHLLLHRPIPLNIPARLLQGQADLDVPWRRSLALAEAMVSSDVEVTLIKDGDHRLSTPANLDLLGCILSTLLRHDCA